MGFLFRLILQSVLFAGVLASEFCQCEAVNSNRIKIHSFGGIQEVCAGLDDAWCSTNCDFFGYNCGYCQWQFGGTSPDKDYKKLTDWCSKQETYDPSQEKYVRGNEVNCYSYKHRVPQEFLWKGCRHTNNDSPRPKPERVVYVNYDKLDNPKKYRSFACDTHDTTAQEKLEKEFLGYNTDCAEVRRPENVIVVACQYKSEGKYNESYNWMKEKCRASGGDFYKIDDGKVEKVAG